MDRSGYVSDTTSICNFPVQSLATADIIPIGLVYLWHTIKAAGLRSFIVNTIHDSVVSEVHPEEIQEYSSIGIDSFTKSVYLYLSTVYNVDFNVPLGVGTKFASHWSEGKEEKIQVEPQST